MPQDNVEEIVHAMRIDQEAAPDLYAAFGFAPYDNTVLWGNALFLFLSVWPLLNMCMFTGMQGTPPLPPNKVSMCRRFFIQRIS